MITTYKCHTRNVEKCIKQTSENTSLLVVKYHYLLRGSRTIILEKLRSKELYSLLISVIDHQATSQKSFENFFLILNYLGKRSTWLRVRRLLTVTYIASIVKLLIMCFIWRRTFSSSARRSLLCVLFVILKLKQHSMFFTNIQLFLFIYFFNFISKLVIFLLYLNSCKIYLFKVAVLYHLILFWWIKKVSSYSKIIQSFQVGVVRHPRIDSKQQVKMDLDMKLIEMNLGTKFNVCMWLCMHKSISFSSFIPVWSGALRSSKSNSQY